MSKTRRIKHIDLVNDEHFNKRLKREYSSERVVKRIKRKHTWDRIMDTYNTRTGKRMPSEIDFYIGWKDYDLVKSCRGENWDKAMKQWLEACNVSMYKPGTREMKDFKAFHKETRKIWGECYWPLNDNDNIRS